MKTVDLSAFIPYGKLTDYPISERDSKCHFKDSIQIKKKQSDKLTEYEMFNVICDQQQCVDSYTFLRRSRFNTRMSYTDWVNKHHLVKHPNAPKLFQIVSFWSTIYDQHAVHTEYQLISTENYEYLKPLNQIYSSIQSSLSCKPPCHFCAYCKAKKVKLSRCGGCKILFYCSKQCQKKHWDLIHKKQCKKWKRKYKHKALTKEEIEDLHTSSLLKLQKISSNYYGPTVDAFNEMMMIRSQNIEGLLFPVQDCRELLVANTMIFFVIEAFDRDGDKKLNFKEWKVMMNELGFNNIDKELFYDFCEDIGCIPVYEASLNNGCYGSYLYDHKVEEILFGPKEIIEILKICAYWRTLSEWNDDDDFKEEYDFHDDKVAYYKAVRLLFKLHGHAQNIVFLRDTSEQDLFDSILTAVPYLNVDIASIIYNYTTMSGQHIINISWHRIKWLNYKEDQDGLWILYDRQKDSVYYDLFYLAKTDSKGYKDITILIGICNNVKKCNDKIKKLSASPLEFSSVDVYERLHPQQKWSLGTTPSYIPEYSFTLKEHAILIGNILKFHNLNTSLCHYIYVGVEFSMVIDDKSQIVQYFNEIYNCNAKYRPHAPKKPSFLSEFNMDMF